MNAILRDIPAAKASEELARLGVPPDERVVVVRQRRLREVAEEIRQEALNRGMTQEILDDILKDV